MASALLTMMALPLVSQSSPSGPPLSAAQTKVIEQKIAGLHSEGDRKVVRSWSNTKKVAEVLCRPAATAYWNKRAPGTDRVFLGTSDPATLLLEGNSKLTGSGQYRNPGGWTDFHFTCLLDAEKGTVIGFETTPMTESTKP